MHQRRPPRVAQQGLDPVRAVVGRALAGYDASEARLIMGHRSDRIEGILGHPGRAALVHRDDLAF